MKEPLFRFENLQIWQRAAVLSITNNIAEGSGSVSDADFANFLNTARRSVFEVANRLVLLTREGYLQELETAPLLTELAEQSRMLHAFRKTLKS